MALGPASLKNVWLWYVWWLIGQVNNANPLMWTSSTCKWILQYMKAFTFFYFQKDTVFLWDFTFYVENVSTVVGMGYAQVLSSASMLNSVVLKDIDCCQKFLYNGRKVYFEFLSF